MRSKPELAHVVYKTFEKDIDAAIINWLQEKRKKAGEDPLVREDFMTYIHHFLNRRDMPKNELILEKTSLQTLLHAGITLDEIAHSGFYTPDGIDIGALALQYRQFYQGKLRTPRR